MSLDVGCGMPALEGWYSSDELLGYLSATGKVTNDIKRRTLRTASPTSQEHSQFVVITTINPIQ